MRLMDTISTSIKPHNSDAEAALLGCVAKSEDCRMDAMERGMKADWFCDQLHKQICDKIIELDGEGDVDDITVALSMAEEVRGKVFDVFDRVETTGRFKFFLDAVEGDWLKRRARDVCQGIIARSEEQGLSATDLIDQAGHDFSQLALNESSRLMTGGEVMENTWKNLEARMRTDGIDGITSGINKLDKLTYGWHQSDLILVAARTSVGKTAFSVELALSALKAGKTVQYFSLEMQNESVMERMLASVSGVPIRVMVDKVMTEGQELAVAEAKSFFRSTKLYMEDDGNMTVATIRAKARKLARKGLDMIVIDYAQLIRPEDGRVSREQQVSSISKGIKNIAKELKIPVVMLAQLKRDADEFNREPKLSDLRESGSLEQDADLVLMLWRKGDDPEKETMLSVSKQRQGRTGKVDLCFRPSIQKFTERIESSLN